jgi:murein DD-endopeptidase MepM/ murein hydrolase activator NlpD
MSTRYGHLSRFNCVPGQEVRRGDVIAYSGSSGRATSPHLHFEVRVGGAAVNPHPYLIRSAMVQTAHSDLPF